MKNESRCDKISIIVWSAFCDPKDTHLKIIPELGEKKKRFGLKLREKDHDKKMGKEKWKLYGVILFFLWSGIWYSQKYTDGDFAMGEALPVEEVGIQEEPQHSSGALQGKIDINLADANELTRLDGIGEKLAEEIVTYRKENGAFRQIEDIMEVSGIGEKTFDKIKENIIVEEVGG